MSTACSSATKFFKSKKVLRFLAFLLIVESCISLGFAYNSFVRSESLKRAYILDIARLAKGFIDPAAVARLRGGPSDLNTKEYHDIKMTLYEIIRHDPMIRFAYLMRRTNEGRYIFLVDAESEDSKDFSPPGQAYEYIDEDSKKPFLYGIPVVAGPTQDSWGTWVSAMVPILDEEARSVKAVLGIDYPAKYWNKTTVDNIGYFVFVFISIVFLIVAYVVVSRKNSRISRLADDVSKKERRLSRYLDDLPGMAFSCAVDAGCRLTYVSSGCEKLTGYTVEELLGDRSPPLRDLVDEDYREAFFACFEDDPGGRKGVHNQFLRLRGKCDRRYVAFYGGYVDDGSGPGKIFDGMFLDIDENVSNESKYNFLLTYDPVTGLLNRDAVKSRIESQDWAGRHPISVLEANIHGMNIINNAYGDEVGNSMISLAASLLQKLTPEGTIGARWSGDDLLMVLPNVGKEEMKEILVSIQRMITLYHESMKIEEKYLNLSLGAVSSDEYPDGQSIANLLREARRRLHYAKVLDSGSDAHDFLETIMTVLYSKSHETERHGERLFRITRAMGESLSLSKQEMDQLSLFSMLHDIGKVGVDDRILNKPGPLTEDEWVALKKHPLIGYKIASTSKYLTSIARLILTHHERWDGTGYPNRLRGEEIPLLSRILAIADTFDAMTSARCYRRPVSKEEAIEEIKRCAGTQFDPGLVEVFIACKDERL